MNNVIGMLIGAELSAQDGESSIKGALEGYVAQAALKVVTPLIVTFAIGWGVQFAVRRAVHALSNDPDTRRSTAARG